VDGIVSAAAAYKEYEITQLAMAEVDRQGRQGSGWMVAVVHASKPGTGASSIWSWCSQLDFWVHMSVLANVARIWWKVANSSFWNHLSV
jgi:hypothetical protein